MKKKLFISLLAMFVVLFSTVEFKAQTRLLHYWHFNNTLPISGGGGTHFGTGKMNSDYTKPAVTTGYLRFVKVPNCVADTGYWDNILGDSINQRPGYGSCCPIFSATTNNSAVRTRNPTDSMQFLWYVPTKNFKNIKLTWESQSSSSGSGQHRMNYSYSLDSGATYITTNLPKLYDSAVVSPAWGKIILNLSGITTINNSNKLILRLKFSAPNTGTSGNNRFDNITVEGDTINGPLGIAEVFNKAKGCSLYPNPTTNNITVSTPFDETKNITITNIIGEIVLSSKQEEKDFSIGTSHLSNGIYFVRIYNQAGENKATLKFVKN